MFRLPEAKILTDPRDCATARHKLQIPVHGSEMRMMPEMADSELLRVAYCDGAS
jgi:hypothetical protein